MKQIKHVMTPLTGLVVVGSLLALAACGDKQQQQQDKQHHERQNELPAFFKHLGEGRNPVFRYTRYVVPCRFQTHLKKDRDEKRCVQQERAELREIGVRVCHSLQLST